MGGDLGGELTRMVIGAAIEVHRELGPGLLEAVYEQCLACELQRRGIGCARQVQLPVVYKGTEIDCRYRIDLVIADALIVEVKSVDHLTPLHDAQVMTYLRLSGYQLALLINFNTVLVKQGIRRIVLSAAISAPLR